MFKASSVTITMVQHGTDTPAYAFTVSGFNDAQAEQEVVLHEEHTELNPFMEALKDALSRVSKHVELDTWK